MTHEEFLESIAQSVIRVAAAIELVAQAFAKEKGAKTKAGRRSKDETLPVLRGFVQKFFGPNKWGFCEFYIQGTKLSTKIKEIYEIADHAFGLEAEVEVAYTTKQKEQYTNYYPQTIEIVDPAKKMKQEAPEMAPDSIDDDAEETPF